MAPPRTERPGSVTPKRWTTHISTVASGASPVRAATVAVPTGTRHDRGRPHGHPPRARHRHGCWRVNGCMDLYRPPVWRCECLDCRSTVSRNSAPALLTQLPWGHNILLIQRLKDPTERLRDLFLELGRGFSFAGSSPVRRSWRRGCREGMWVSSEDERWPPAAHSSPLAQIKPSSPVSPACGPPSQPASSPFPSVSAFGPCPCPSSPCLP